MRIQIHNLWENSCFRKLNLEVALPRAERSYKITEWHQEYCENQLPEEYPRKHEFSRKFRIWILIHRGELTKKKKNDKNIILGRIISCIKLSDTKGSDCGSEVNETHGEEINEEHGSTQTNEINEERACTPVNEIIEELVGDKRRGQFNCSQQWGFD